MREGFLEVELKYRSSNIKLEDFVEALKPFGVYRYINVASHDYYYVKADSDDFVRYREGSAPELTIKQKKADKNNFVRTEVNLKLAEQTRNTVEAFCRLLGYEHNFTIYKTCFIYVYSTFNVVFYIVYDTNLQEQDRFIEIEMSEEHEWQSQDECWNALLEIEKTLAPLGITSSNRIRKSLFEMFRR